MKLNLLNLLKANVLKPGVIKTIAPVTESGKASEFKSVLSGVQAIPPPGLNTNIPNVDPPIEESAVLISKRYSKSHAESQGKVKESGKSEKLVEQTLQTAISTSSAIVAAQSAGAPVLQPMIMHAPHEVKQLPVDNHVVSKAAPVVRTPEAAKAASKAKAMPESTRAPVLQPVNKVVPERVSQNGTVEAPLRKERSTSATPLVPPLVISRERTLQNPVTNRQSDKQSSHVPNEFSVVRATNTLELQTSRIGPMIVTEAPRHNATKTRQEVATNPKRVGQDMMTPKTPVLRESGELRTTSKNQDAAKPYSPVQLAQKREEPLVKSDLKASSSAIQSRGDTTPVKRVTSKIAGTLKDLRNESMRHGSNQVPPAKEQVQPQPVFVSKSRFVALEPNVQVTPANERPQVVQQIWANDIVKAGVKPMRGEQTIRAQVPQSLYKPQVQSKPLINVDSAYVRPTLEASALKQPTLADAKLNAAANPRVILEPERFQKPLIEKQIQAEPLHKATAVARESRSPERSISTTAPRNHQRAENSEPSNFFNKVEFGTNDFVIAKMGHAPVVTDPARHLKPHSVVDKAAIQRQATSETTFKRDNTIESKSQNVTSPNSGPNIQSVKPELKIEQLSARVPFATLPEFELPKQSALSSSVNEPVDESIQSETSPAPVDPRPTPAKHIESKLETRSTIPSESGKESEVAGQNSQTPLATKIDGSETAKETTASTLSFKPLTAHESQMKPMPQAIQEFGTVGPRIDTMKAPEFMRNDRTSVEREEPTLRSTQERPQQVSEGKPNEQSNHNVQDMQSQSRERETGQSALSQTIEQTTQTSPQAPISKSNHPSQSAANESLKLALQKALDQSRKRMVDPDELRMSIPFGELGTMDIDIVREAEKFSIRIAADPQAIAMMEDQRIQLTHWLRMQGYPVEQIDITPRFAGESKSDLPGSNQSTEERSSGGAGKSGRPNDGRGGVGEEHAEVVVRPAFSGLRVWTA